MATVIDMPKLSDTMTVGTLVKWLKNEGDTIEIGDLIAEVETDKATMELEAFDDGVLLKRVASMGDEVPIGGALAVIGEAGEAVDLQALGVFSPAPKESELAREEPEIETEVTAEILVSVTGGPEGVETAAAEPVISQPVQTIGRIKASPLAKRLAAKMGVDLRTIRGSGPGGRIVKADVESASKPAADQPAASAGAPVATPAGAPAARSPIAVAGRIPLSNMRKVIARRLMDSKSQVPHYYLETEAEMGPLMKMREDLNARLSHLPPEQGDVKLTVTDFILKATVEALRRVPAVNASWGGDHLLQHGAVHLGVAVAVDDGLVVPVIRHAQAKSLKQISAELKLLAGKARDKKIKPKEMTGSTFTVSTLGMFGVTGFFGIINQPNAGILCVGRAAKQPVVDEDDQIAVGYRMTVGGSFDHRVVDGAVGAQFLKALREILETPASILGNTNLE